MMKKQFGILFGVLFALIYIGTIVVQMLIVLDIDHLRAKPGGLLLVRVRRSHKQSFPRRTFYAIGALPLLIAVYAVVFCVPVKTFLRVVSAIALGIVVSLFATHQLFSSYSRLCLYNANEFRSLCTFSNNIMDEMRHRFGNNSVWLQNGTLLGVIRNQSDTNYLVRNDHDFDLCYSTKYVTAMQIAAMFEELGIFYECKLCMNRFVPGDAHVRAYPKSLSLVVGHSGPLMTELESCVPTELRRTTGCNGQMTSVPVDAEKILKRNFGKSWRIRRSTKHGAACRYFPES